MKKISCFFVCLFVSFVCAAAPLVGLSKEPPAKLDFRSISVAQVVQLIYSEVLQDSYVIDPEVLGDQRVVSFRYDAGKGDLRVFVASFFDSLGLLVSRRGPVDYVLKKPVPVAPVPQDPEVFVYRPQFRDGAYLTEILSPLFKGSFTTKRVVKPALGDAGASSQRIASPGSALASIDQKTDTLIFMGAAVEIDKLKKFLPQVDFAVGDVLVRGVLYEVQTGTKDGSAFGLALNLLGGKFGLGLGSVAVSPGNSFVSFKNQSIDAVLSALSNDVRFKAVSKPMLRVTSGGSGRFTVGQDVPVLSSVSYPGAGQAPVQSVTYQSSGVIYDIQPVVRDGSIDVSVMQQTSNFVVTNTGVGGSPTLNKRELKSNLNLTDGELVVMGGLSESKDAESREGVSFLPSLLRTKSDDRSSIEILLILQVTKL